MRASGKLSGVWVEWHEKGRVEGKTGLRTIIRFEEHRDWLTGNGDAEGVMPMKALAVWQPWAYVYNLELAKRAAPYRSGKSDKKFMFAASSHRRASSRSDFAILILSKIASF